MLEFSLNGVEFSFNGEREVEYLNNNTDGEVSDERVEKFIDRIDDENLITFGSERTEVSLDFEDGMVTIVYRYIDNIGEDWNDDEWVDGEKVIIKE